ncbi:MAG: histidinol dehydrogenase, partial [Metallibacterium scheffleri]
MQSLIWNDLSAAQRVQALQRPVRARGAAVRDGVARIIEQVRADGDAALRLLTRRHDGVTLDVLEVSDAEFDSAETVLDTTLKIAIAEAAARIEQFHAATAPQPARVQTAPGVVCERMLRPITRVGLYVPAGSAPLPSTVLMLAVPARLAGCPEVVICTPARGD